MEFIRGNISTELLKENESEKVRLINLVIEICKRKGLGKLSQNQRISYSENELEILKKIIDFVLWIHKNECRNFRTTKETIRLIEIFLESIKKENQILFFALFCPAYKKGKDVYGFKEKIGNTTKRGVCNLSTIFEKAISLGINCSAVAIYSDLVLENFSKLEKEDYKSMEKNFEDFKEYGMKINPNIEYLKISEIGESKKIGYEGIISGEILINEKEILGIASRSIAFYRDILGWNFEDIIERTKVLARSCSFMVEEIKKENDSLLMIMTENIYERGRLYQAKSDKNMPIFYPKKLNDFI